MKRAISLCTVVLVCGLAGVAGAQSDTYLPSNQPLVKGTVVAIGDHSVTVDSFNGERMVFTIDSRTVIPTNLAVGTRVKVEFHAMEDGRYHAARVTPFEPTTEEIASIRPVTVGIEGDLDGDGDVDATDEHIRLYGDGSTSGAYGTTGTYGTSSTTTSDRYAGRPVDTDTRISGRTDVDGDGDADANAVVSTRSDRAYDDDLPRTGSERQGLWMIGLGALGLAGTLWFVRRNRTV